MIDSILLPQRRQTQVCVHVLPPRAHDEDMMLCCVLVPAIERRSGVLLWQGMLPLPAAACVLKQLSLAQQRLRQRRLRRLCRHHRRRARCKSLRRPRIFLHRPPPAAACASSVASITMRYDALDDPASNRRPMGRVFASAAVCGAGITTAATTSTSCSNSVDAGADDDCWDVAGGLAAQQGAGHSQVVAPALGPCLRRASLSLF